jgi:CheY-like chemotaxis protein
MVRQILGFARGSGGQGAPVTIECLAREMTKIVEDTFPKSIEISLRLPGRELWRVQGDPTELHQVLLNLCVNARDAMPTGGRLSLSAENITLSGAEAAAFQAVPGTYVRIAVGDTGTGIPPEALPRIFEPFYTTKPLDKGTGLGLSTVARIVKSRHGFIDLTTEANKGTEFRVYLPASQTLAESGTLARTPLLPTGRNELILIADDEESLRELMKTVLEACGYRVISAQNGVEGVAQYKEHREAIRLVISDTDMPLMDGLAMMSAITKMQPDVPVIIASGSRHNTELVRKSITKNLTHLAKPYTVEQLLTTVAAVLKR